MNESSSSTPGESNRHQIGEVAEAVGLSLRTIRHYEEVGLVPPSSRTAGGFRLYTDADIERLRMVKRMKPLDLSLEEMGEVLALQASLAERELDEAEFRAARERLCLLVALVEERCDRLREQLAGAEEVLAVLQRDTRRRRSDRSRS